MTHNYNEIFEKIYTIPHIPDIATKITHEVSLRKQKSLRIRKLAYTGVSLISFTGICTLFVYINTLVRESGAYEYIALIFTDASVMSFWKELLLSLTDSLPFLEFSLFFMSLGIFLFTLEKVTRLNKTLQPLLTH